MTSTRQTRYCRCGARLARDNTGGRCSPCSSHDRQHPESAPKVPADFWNEVVLARALQDRHMGRVIRAWRTHPYHGRHPISQDQAASWVGMSQAQLSRIENGPPSSTLTAWRSGQQCYTYRKTDCGSRCQPPTKSWTRKRAQ